MNIEIPLLFGWKFVAYTMDTEERLMPHTTDKKYKPTKKHMPKPKKKVVKKGKR